MTKLTYSCLRCGSCCRNLKIGNYIRRIPLYPNEVKSLIAFIEKEKLVGLRKTFKVIEDLIFPDIKNKKVIVITYKILLSISNMCPFYSNDIGCRVQALKPLACQAYPLSIKKVDAFNSQITIDSECAFVKNNYDILINSDIDYLKQIFGKEYLNAEKFLDKNKNIILRLKQLEFEKSISIPDKISRNQLESAIQNWDRIEFSIE